MWPFRRRQPAPARPVHVARAARPADWPALPLVQRVLAEPPVVVETSSFEAGLPTRQDPSFLAPLSHQVSPAAPAGSADVAGPVTRSSLGDSFREKVAFAPPLASVFPDTAAWAPAVQRAVSATVTPPRPTLVSAPQVAHPLLELPSLAGASSAEENHPQAGVDAPAPVSRAASSAAEAEGPPSSAVPTLGARPDDPTAAAEQVDSPTAAATQHAWRSRPGGVGLPLREVPGRVQRSDASAGTPSGTSAGSPVQRATITETRSDGSGQVPDGPPSAGDPAPERPLVRPAPASPGAGPPREAAAAEPALAGSSQAPRPHLPADQRGAPLVGDRPMQRQAADAPSPPAPVQLSRPARSAEWLASERLPDGAASPDVAAFAPGSRPLLGDAPLRAPGSGVAGGDRQSAVSPPGLASRSGLAVARAAVPAPGPAVQLMRPRAGQPAVPALHAVPRQPFVPVPALPPAQRSTPSRIADPGAAAIAAGVASRDADGSVVFRSLLDDAMSSGRDVASSAASGAIDDTRSRASDVIGDARSTATDAASSALSSASDTATSAVTSAASSVASAAGLPAPAAAGSAGSAGPAAAGAAPADLDDLARKLYDRLRHRLTTELRLDRERSGCVTDLPR